MADNSIANLRSLMPPATLEDIFSEVAVEHGVGAISREIADSIHA